jgi:hypothetical protein
MKYLRLGCMEPGKFEDEQHALLDQCFEDNDHLRANGHVVAEAALQPPETAVTLYWKTAKSRRASDANQTQKPVRSEIGSRPTTKQT